MADRIEESKQGTVAVWSFTSDNASDILRRIADRLDETEGVLIGMWSTGFAEAWQVNIQCIVDIDDDPVVARREETNRG